MYQTLSKIGTKLFSQSALFKYGFNYSPMYKRSTGRIYFVSEDLMTIKVKIPISWKNRNYANSIFGGSMFSAVDPIYMVQLLNILGEDYVVWDKSANVQFKRPAKEDLYTEFIFSPDEISDFKERVKLENEFTFTKVSELKNKEGKVFCTIEKEIYVSSKSFYKKKLKQRKS